MPPQQQEQDRPVAVAGAVRRDVREGMIPFRVALARHPGRAAELRAWMAEKAMDASGDTGPDSVLWCVHCRRAVPAGDVWVAPVREGEDFLGLGHRLWTRCPADLHGGREDKGTPCEGGLLYEWDSARLTWQDGPMAHWPQVPEPYERYRRVGAPR